MIENAPLFIAPHHVHVRSGRKWSTLPDASISCLSAARAIATAADTAAVDVTAATSASATAAASATAPA